jgi:hypothetical protein
MRGRADAAVTVTTRVLPGAIGLLSWLPAPRGVLCWVNGEEGLVAWRPTGGGRCRDPSAGSCPG